MNGKTYGIIGTLYHRGFKHYRMLNTVSEYFSLFFNIENMENINDPAISGIMLYDYFPKSIHPDFKKIVNNKEIFISHIKEYVNDLNQDQKNEFNTLLFSITESLDKYPTVNIRSSKQSVDPNLYDSYSQDELRQLTSYFSAKSDVYNLEYNIYNLIYLAVYKKIEPNFFFGPNYHQQLEDFNKEVTCKYGTTSKPGIRAIIDLATKKNPNLFALYEYADILYYGRENGPKKDIYGAFKTYQSISKISDQASCHPLALWSLAYIYFNYHQPKSELNSCNIIPDIEELTRLEQVKKATELAQYAYALTSNAAAANILGKISLLSEDELPGIEAIKKSYHLKAPIEYFEEAVEHNYIYAYGNLSWIYLERIFTEGVDHQKENLDKYISILAKQAEQNEPWAANTLGVFYHNGKVTSKKSGKQESFRKYISSKKSFMYFSMAINSDFTDYNSGWAIANVLIFFPERFYEEPQAIIKSVQKMMEIGNKAAIAFFTENFSKTYKNLLIPKIFEKIESILE